jgi:hypothetical protein
MDAEAGCRQTEGQDIERMARACSRPGEQIAGAETCERVNQTPLMATLAVINGGPAMLF